MLLTGGVFRLLKQSIKQTELQEAHTYLKLFNAQAPVFYGKICICEEFVNSYICTLCRTHNNAKYSTWLTTLQKHNIKCTKVSRILFNKDLVT